MFSGSGSLPGVVMGLVCWSFQALGLVIKITNHKKLNKTDTARQSDNITSLFHNTRTLKFKTQPPISFSLTAANIVADVSANIANIVADVSLCFRQNGQRSCLWAMIGGFRSILSISVFKRSNVCRHNYD